MLVRDCLPLLVAAFELPHSSAQRVDTDNHLLTKYSRLPSSPLTIKAKTVTF